MEFPEHFILGCVPNTFDPNSGRSNGAELGHTRGVSFMDGPAQLGHARGMAFTAQRQTSMTD